MWHCQFPRHGQVWHQLPDLEVLCNKIVTIIICEWILFKKICFYNFISNWYTYHDCLNGLVRCYFQWHSQDSLYVLGQHGLKPHSNNEKDFSKGQRSLQYYDHNTLTFTIRSGWWSRIASSQKVFTSSIRRTCAVNQKPTLNEERTFAICELLTVFKWLRLRLRLKLKKTLISETQTAQVSPFSLVMCQAHDYVTRL
jgi:hypothetical protein